MTTNVQQNSFVNTINSFTQTVKNNPKTTAAVVATVVSAATGVYFSDNISALASTLNDSLSDAMNSVKGFSFSDAKDAFVNSPVATHVSAALLGAGAATGSIRFSNEISAGANTVAQATKSFSAKVYNDYLPAAGNKIKTTVQNNPKTTAAVVSGMVATGTAVYFRNDIAAAASSAYSTLAQSTNQFGAACVKTWSDFTGLFSGNGTTVDTEPKPFNGPNEIPEEQILNPTT